MSNPSKRKGTDFEVLVRDYLIENWDDRIVRIAQAGANDLGDLANFRVAGQKICLELKATDEYRSNLAGWIKEAERERNNLGALATCVIHKRKGIRAAQEQYVTLTLKDFLTICALSEGRGSVPL